MTSQSPLTTTPYCCLHSHVCVCECMFNSLNKKAEPFPFLVTKDLEEATEMLIELEASSRKVGLKMNVTSLNTKLI